MAETQRLRIAMLSHATDASREIVAGHLHAAVGLETDDGVELLDARDLADLGISFDAAYREALDTLREWSEPGQLREADTLPGLFFLKSHDDHAASRLMLLPELFGSLPFGGVVAAVPVPDQLLCVPLDSAAAVDALQALASAVGHVESTREEMLSSQLFWFDGSFWRPIPVHHGDEDIQVLPPPAFMQMMGRLASMDLVLVAGEA